MAAFGAPQLVDDGVKFLGIIAQTGGICRLGSGDDCPCLDEIANLAQYRQRHVLAMRIECQHAVPHTTRSSELSVLEREQVNQRVRIDVIEVVTGRNVRALSAEERGKVRILAIEVHNVSIKAPLLEQIGTSRQVRNPRLGLFCPGLVAVEPLTEGSEGESGLFVEQGLMNR